MNPHAKAFTKSDRGFRSFHKQIDNVQTLLSNTNAKNRSQGKRSVADCGSVANGPVAMNMVSKQGILTSNKFAALMEVPWEDDSVSLHNDSTSCLSNSHVEGTIPTRTTVSVTSSTKTAPTVSDPNTHVELSQCQPLFICKTDEDDDLGKTSFKGNKNKTGLSNQGSNQSLAHPIRCDNNEFIHQLNVTDNISTSLDSQLENEHLHSTFDHRKNIQDHIWVNRFRCADFQACTKQNGYTFGFIPLSPLAVYTGDHKHWDFELDIIQMHHIIKQTGLPNFLGARIPVPSQLRPDRWRFHLKFFWDSQLVDLIQYGFPLDFDRTRELQSADTNHVSGLQHLDHIENYVTEECAFNAMYGPFQEPPIALHISPLMTRSKQNYNKSI